MLIHMPSSDISCNSRSWILAVSLGCSVLVDGGIDLEDFVLLDDTNYQHEKKRFELNGIRAGMINYIIY